MYILAQIFKIKTYQKTAIDDCKNVLKEISAFAETGFDVIKEMKLLAKQLPQLLRLVGPAGIVLSELASLGLKVRSIYLHT